MPEQPDLPHVLAKYEIDLDVEQTEQLQDYCHLLWKFNKDLNLTRHTDYEQFATRDVFDSLQISVLLEPEETILDVGTGGGMPGLILAILRPDLNVSLCDSVGKKARAVAAMVDQLQIKAEVYEGRAEHILARRSFDSIVARAVGPLPRMLRWFQPHWSSIGKLLAVKGPKWIEERKQARDHALLRDLQVRKAAEYKTPGINSENVILKIWPKTRDES